MCGIAGTIGSRQQSQSVIARTLGRMRERGPDASGCYQGEIRGNAITLLHSRLAILDLDERANQPFCKDGLILVYNGEIYNFVELRAELEAAQHCFTTTSDTEVILEAYRRWGADCVDRFEGMWAFALFDSQEQRLLLSRDRFGEKPLYYAMIDGDFYFASETSYLWSMAGARAPVNDRQLRRYLVNGYKSLYKQNETFYQNVDEVPAASIAILDGPRRPEIRRYWTLTYTPRRIDAETVAAEVRDRLTSALALRLRSDVPIAFCLSGGVDSTTLAAIASRTLGQPIHAYSLYASDDRYDESRNADATVAALGLRHTTRVASKERFMERLTDLVAYYDAPVATISFYIESLLAEAIHEDGYKVAITGNGADELFTGYYDHYNFWLAQIQDRPDFERQLCLWRDSYGKFVRNPVLKDPRCFVTNPRRRDHIYLNREIFNALLVEPQEEDFFEEDYDEDLIRNRLLNEIRHESLPVLLRDNDLVFMRYSIENRTPFLDRDLAEFLFSVPSDHLIRDGFPKWLLREASAGLLPDGVRLDRRKRGFNAPITSLIDLNDGAVLDQLLADSPIFDIVQRERLADFIAQADERNSFSKFLFGFISAKLFLDQTQRAVH